MALVPPFFLDCVVAIGTVKPNGNKYWIGTGFLFGEFVKQAEGNIKEYKIFLVSNKHVLENQQSVILRFNPRDDQPAKDYTIQLKDEDGKDCWIGHVNDNVDIGVIGINAKKLQKEGMKFGYFHSDTMAFTIDKLKEIGTTEGDYVYVLGFPMGLVACDRQFVILRNGTIGRIRDLFEKRSTDFIVDAFVFPGNSGGPVILKPEMISISGTRSNLEAALIGVVKSYIPYQDTAISQQTGRPRIIFEDNSGLSIVEPVDYIIETIELYNKNKAICQ